MQRLLTLPAAQRSGASDSDVDDRTLVLNGSGVREYGVFGVDVYAAGLYLSAPMHDAARACGPYLSDNCRPDCVYPSAQAQRFLNPLPDTVEGDTQTYVFTGDRVEMLRNERFIGAIEGGGFARLLLSTWIGESPSTETLKQALLGRRRDL